MICKTFLPSISWVTCTIGNPTGWSQDHYQGTPAVGIYPKDTDVVKRQDTCTPMFIAAMSTIAKLWKELRSPLTDEWTGKMWCIYIQWNITQPLQVTNTHHLLQRGWNWRVLC